MRQTLLFILLLFSFFAVKAQNVYVYKTDGSFQEIPLSNVRNITFNGNNMIMSLASGGTITWDINQIDKYSYKSITLIKDLGLPEFSFEIFPNPFTDYFILIADEMRTNLLVEILNVSGEVLCTKNIEVINTDSEIRIKELENLLSGVYFCKITDDRYTFTQKIIKK